MNQQKNKRLTTQGLRLLTTSGLLLLAISATYAQGLGGLLNKAKQKINQTTSTPTQTTQDTEYQLPPNLPNDPSIEEMEKYARAMLADTRPVPKSEWGSTSDGNQYYRRLTQNEGYPIKFTWDKEAVTILQKRQSALFGYFEDFSSDLVSQLAPYTERHVQVGTALRKVKEIHFTSIAKPEMTGEDGQQQGWWFSYNPTTGVLSAAITASENLPGPSSLYSAASLSKWIVRHIR